MSMPKYTPGPWSVAPGMPTCIWTDTLATGRGVAVTAMAARTQEEQIANARLIAEAPELLRFAEFVRREIAGIRAMDPNDDRIPRILSGIRTEADKVITRAEGE